MEKKLGISNHQAIVCNTRFLQLKIGGDQAVILTVIVISMIKYNTTPLPILSYVDVINHSSNWPAVLLLYPSLHNQQIQILMINNYCHNTHKVFIFAMSGKLSYISLQWADSEGIR